MEEVYSSFSNAMEQIVHLGGLKVLPSELKKLQEASQQAQDLYSIVHTVSDSCKDSFNVRCATQVVIKSSCKQQFRNFVSCVEYVNSDSTPQEFRTTRYCSKRELEFKTCVSDLMTEIIFQLSQK